MKPTHVGSTQTNAESKWTYSPQPAKVTKTIQTQTQFQENPQAQTAAYNRLLDKANEEKTKCIKSINRNEMVIQTEVLDHSPPREKGQQTSTNQGQWEQPQAQMINQHQQTSQAMLSNMKYNNRREYKTDRNQTSGPYYDQYYLNPGQDYHNTGNRFDHYDQNR